MDFSSSFIAITHVPSPRMQACVRTFVGAAEIDYELARRQHASYCSALEACGAKVVTLDVNRDQPDSVFVEDAAVVLDEIAIIGVMGTESRRLETAGIEAALGKYRGLLKIKPPATLEGGDVLRVGKTLLVGLSSRTNAAGVESLTRIVAPLGYQVATLPVRGCLHLKTGCTALPDGTLLVNRNWVDVEGLEFDVIEVPRVEPWGANVVLAGSKVIVPANHIRTAEMIARRGFEVCPVDISEFQKAEGGVTCLSILVSNADVVDEVE
jgi:dimethylargininase